MDVIKSMNGKIWIFASILIALVVVQAVLFLRLALNTNKKYNILSKSEINQALKTGGNRNSWTSLFYIDYRIIFNCVSWICNNIYALRCNRGTYVGINDG